MCPQGCGGSSPPFGTTSPTTPSPRRATAQRHDVAAGHEAEDAHAETDERRDDHVDERAAERVQLDQPYRLVGKRRVRREAAHDPDGEEQPGGLGEYRRRRLLGERL